MSYESHEAHERLQAARRLIESGQYKAARALLETMPGLDAVRLLTHLERLERRRPPSLLRPPYLFFVLLGLLIPLTIGVLAFVLLGAGRMPPPPLTPPTALPTLPVFPTPTATPTVTASATLTLTPTDTVTPTETRSLPATWTPTNTPVVLTPDATASALAEFVATGQMFIDITRTVAARNAALSAGGRPDNAD
jgi:hypothetical protein